MAAMVIEIVDLPIYLFKMMIFQFTMLNYQRAMRFDEIVYSGMGYTTNLGWNWRCFIIYHCVTHIIANIPHYNIVPTLWNMIGDGLLWWITGSIYVKSFTPVPGYLEFGGFLMARGTPSHHPFLDGDFPWNKLTITWGTPMAMEPPICISRTTSTVLLYVLSQPSMTIATAHAFALQAIVW